MYARGMLREYEADCHTGMDVEDVSEQIYQYTSGYPYLVSLICKTIDEILPVDKEHTDKHFVWTRKGITEASPDTKSIKTIVEAVV